MTLTAFKSYDIRGRLGEELNEAVARRVGRAFAEVMSPGLVITGHDARETSPALSAALVEGLRAGGANVRDLGLCGTEEVYHATGALDAGGGIMVTASHNPIDYNGMKLVGRGSRPIDPKTTFATIREVAEGITGEEPSEREGRYDYAPMRDRFASDVCDFIEVAALRPMKVLLNAGNGAAGPTADAILNELAARGAPLTVARQFWEPDGSFPNGIPNPLLPENRGATAERVVAEGADLGVAWDGDFDRCFFFDETGAFLDGEYVVALLAQSFMASEPGADIVYDPRVVWATEDTVAAGGGTAHLSRVGHAFVKTEMRRHGAVYGGEMSAHHYFRDFYFCDSGMIPWLKVIELMSRTGRSLSELVAQLRARFPSSGEINFRVADPQAAIEALVARFGGMAQVDRLDGASFDFGGWRANIRASNTEPLLRLNLETRGDAALLQDKVNELRGMIAALETDGD